MGKRIAKRVGDPEYAQYLSWNDIEGIAEAVLEENEELVSYIKEAAGDESVLIPVKTLNDISARAERAERENETLRRGENQHERHKYRRRAQDAEAIQWAAERELARHLRARDDPICGWFAQMYRMNDDRQHWKLKARAAEAKLEALGYGLRDLPRLDS